MKNIIYIAVLFIFISCSCRERGEVSYIYDDNGNKIRIDLKNKYSSDTLTKHFDDNGNLLKVVLKDENSNIINIQEYDNNKNVVTIYKYKENAVSEILEFNDEGKKVKEKIFISEDNFYYYIYQYSDNNLIQKDEYDKHDFLIKKEIYKYDGAGKKISQLYIDTKNDTSVEYNCGNEKIIETHSDTKGNILYTFEKYNTNDREIYSYYKNGNIDNVLELSTKDKVIKKTFFKDKKIVRYSEYDFSGNKLKESNYNNGNLKDYIKYEYDNDGKQLSKKNYNKENRLERVYKYQYDNRGNIIKILTYDGDGNIIEYE